MKVAVFLVLCVAATSLAIPSAARARPRRQLEECENSPPGLAGVLEQLGNLVGNILDNVGRLQLSGLLTGNNGVLHVLSDLLKQVARILNDLLGSNVSDHDATEEEGLLTNLLHNIQDLLNDTLGDNSGTEWACNSSKGLAGTVLSKAIGSLGNLTGSFANDQGLLTGLIQIVTQLVNSLVALLV